MRIISDDLYQLIKSLSKAEKSVFRKFATRQLKEGRNNYIKLYSAVEAQLKAGSGYDEEKIIKKFKGEKFIKYLSVHKNYLYNSILKSLNLYHSDLSLRLKIRKLINQFEILAEKSLYIQAERVLKRAKDIAYKTDLFIPILEILDLERIVKRNLLDLPELNRFIEENIKERNLVFEKALNISEYTDLIYRLNCLLRKNIHYDKRNVKDRQMLDKFFNDPLLKNEICALSYKARMMYYNMHAAYYDRIGGKKIKGYDNLKKIIKLMESQPEKMKTWKGSYLTVLVNLLTHENFLKKYDDFVKTLHKLKNIKNDFPFKISLRDKLELLPRIYLNELLWYISTGKLNRGIEVVMEAELWIKKSRDKIENIGDFYTLSYYISYFYFINHDYQKALLYSNRILNMGKKLLAQDIQCDSRILNLLIHFELGNQDALEYAMKSTYRFLSKRERMFKFENIILLYLRKSFKAATIKELYELLRQLRYELKKIPKDELKNSLFSLDLISWIDSKLENRKMADVMAQKSNSEIHS